MDYRVISADNHVMEPPGTFVERVPVALRDRAPQVMQSPKGGEGWTFNGQLPKMTLTLWPRSSELIPKLTRGLPEATTYQLLAGNAIRVFNLN